MFDRIAIIGAGSLGTILGAHIAQHRQVDLVDTYQEHVDALNTEGAKVVGFRSLTVPVKALLTGQMEGTYDLFIIMNKQTANDAVIELMKQHSNDGTVYLTCQNGLPELAFVKAFGEDKVFGAPIGWGATFISPGVSELTSKDPISSTLGSVTGKSSETLLAIKEILEYMHPITISDNLLGLRWCKVLMNAALSGMSAVCGDTYGYVMDNPKGLKSVSYIGKECVAVAEAMGVKMEPFHQAGQEHYFTEIFNFTNEQERLKKTVKGIFDVWTPHRALEASMLQDLRKGQKCEIAFINGAVSDCGKEVGVATPYNDKVVEIISKIDEGLLGLSHENLNLMPNN